MNKSFSQSWLYQTITSCILFASVFLFFGLIYPHHLHFQEQNQLFLFDSSYISDIISVPGGVADLIGRFLTQFFLLAWIGAAIIAAILLCIFLLSIRKIQQGWLKALGLIPAISLGIFLSDENSLLGGAVAVLLALVADCGLSAINNRVLRQSLYIISTPVLYWLLGPVAVVCSILYIISAIKSHDKADSLVAFVSLFLMCIMPVIAQYCVAVPLDRLFTSPHYYRVITTVPNILWVAVIAVIILPILPATSDSKWLTLTSWIIIICAGGYYIKDSYNARSEEVMSYDFMCRFQQWNRLIDTANNKKPKNSLSCTALNLALGMRGELGDRMFEYNQNGLAGLLPSFERDPVSPLTTGEAYFQLGLINTAQRFVFEAQEAIPDFQKSGRCYKRLAETNLLNGNYEVARKYISSLSKTIFYSDWADEVMPLLNNEEAISKHPVYGRLRSLMPKQDDMFQEGDFSQVLSQLVVSNGTNQLAYEYLQCSLLLQGDLDSFASNLKMSEGINYQHMPYSFQQAYGLCWSRNHGPQEKMPDFIHPSYVAGLNEFFTAVNQKPVNKNYITSRFGNTYWYYYISHF